MVTKRCCICGDKIKGRASHYKYFPDYHVHFMCKVGHWLDGCRFYPIGVTRKSSKFIMRCSRCPKIKIVGREKME